MHFIIWIMCIYVFRLNIMLNIVLFIIIIIIFWTLCNNLRVLWMMCVLYHVLQHWSLSAAVAAAELLQDAVGDPGSLSAVQRWFPLRPAHIRRPPDARQQTRRSPDRIVARSGGLLVPGVCGMAGNKDGNSYEHQHGSDGPLHCALGWFCSLLLRLMAGALLEFI